MERGFTHGTSLLRSAGPLAVASGVIGIGAFVFLMTAVTTRTTWSLSSRVDLLFKAHDIAVMLQFLFLIPVAFALRELSSRSPPGISIVTIYWGTGALFMTALLLLLGVGKIVNDMSYMLPQGVFGAWLIVVNLRLSALLPRWLRYFGLVVGFGLVMVGTVFPGLAVFVYPNMLKVPAIPVDSETFQNTETNRIFHLVLNVGSLLGVVTLPIWTVFAGSFFLNQRHSDSPATAKF